MSVNMFSQIQCKQVPSKLRVTLCVGFEIRPTVFYRPYTICKTCRVRRNSFMARKHRRFDVFCKHAVLITERDRNRDQFEFGRKVALVESVAFDIVAVFFRL